MSSLLLPASPPSPPSPSLFSLLSLGRLPHPISLNSGAVVAERGRGGGRAVYRSWSSSSHQLCLELQTKHNKYLGSSPAVLSLNLAIRTPNLSGLLVLRTQLPPHPTPPSHLPPSCPGASTASGTRNAGLSLGSSTALGSNGKSHSLSVPPFPHPKNSTVVNAQCCSHVRPERAEHPLCAGPCGIPGNSRTDPLPIGKREGPRHSTGRKWSAPQGRSRFVLRVCLQQGAALPAAGVRGDFEDIWAVPARKALTSQLSGILLPFLESFRLTQLSQVVDAFPEFCSHVHTPTYPQKATPESGRLG
ncbi:uncharacterized protein [Equus przewalskii]|uniref:Uncharacterized protein n=1 Tax=Equus przewalskii TaxID=9798 RepID=A0ABM4PSF1_EQUPR